MHTPEEQVISFHTDSADMMPRRAWSDLSGLFSGAEGASGMMVLQHKQNPDYPGDWIQYPDLSWVQPTFPASGTRFKLEKDKELVLRYRIIVHTGIQPSEDSSALFWDAFNFDDKQKLTFSF